MSLNIRRLPKRLATLNQEQIAYINGCSTLQKAVWRITHEDPLLALRSQIKKFILREAILVLINIRERNKRAILKLALLKWLKNAKNVSQNIERLRALLKIIFLNYESKTKSVLSKYLLRWSANTSVSEEEILKKYGYLLKFLDLLTKKSLLPAKYHFMANLERTSNPEHFQKPLKNCFKYYNRNLLDKLRRAFNIWRLNARNGAMNELKKIVIRNIVVSTIINKDKQLLLKALRNWRTKVMADRLFDEFNDADLMNRLRALIIIYGKWNRINRLNQLARAFAKWRVNTTDRGEPLNSRILRAKKHMLKHNINKNAEDLLNSLKNIAQTKRIEKLLKKFILRAPKYNLPILRKAFRKWHDNVNTLNNRDLLRKIQMKYVTDMAERNRKDQTKNILRKAFQTWRRITMVPKTSLPDTEKAINLLRKATVQPFFQKMRDNILKDMNEEKFKALIKAYFRKNDKDLLHWWFGQWRKNALRLKVYELKALLIKHLTDSKERNDKLQAIRTLKEKLNNYRFKDILKTMILRNLINRIEKINDEINKAKMVRALYIWRTKLDTKKDKEKLEKYNEGAKILRRYCWRVTHEDILNAFDYKITFPAQDKALTKLLNRLNRNNIREILLKKLYKWRMKCVKPEEDPSKKLRELLLRYIDEEPFRKKRFALYKDIPKALKKAREIKEDAARKIADYLRGIKEIPDQVRNLRISKYLLKIINNYSEKDYQRIKSVLNEWARRARIIKADEDARTIQKFIRDKLNKRLKKKARFEEAVEHTKNYILMRIFDKISDYADKNRIPDILIKYYLRKNADVMKLLRDKFNHWRNLLPHMRLEDAATTIQANVRGYQLRKDFYKFNRISEILYKYIERLLDRKEVEPAFLKWKKNARKAKCNDDARIIQSFIRKNLNKLLKSQAQDYLQGLFKAYIFKLIAKMMSTKSINPDDIEKLSNLLKRIACNEPFKQLMKGLRWKIILNKLRNIPKIYDRSRNALLRKYLERWYINAIEIPDEMATKIQNSYRRYLAINKLKNLQKLRYILENLILKYKAVDDDKKLATLKKWNKNARLIKCDEDARCIQKFCRKIHNKALLLIREKWENLAKKIISNRINKTAKFNNMNKLLNKLLKKRFFDKLIDNVNKKNLKEILKYLVTKFDKNALQNLLRRRLREWLDKAKKLRDIDNDAATYIQSIYRGYLTRRDLNRKTRLQDILTKLLLRLIHNSDATLPSAIQKWRKNARLIECDENSRIIQKFCRKALDKIKKLKEEEYLKKIKDGLDKLSNLRLNVRYAWDKIKDNNKINALKDLVGNLQDLINNKKREVFEEIYEYGINKLLNRLFPLREKFIKDILRKKLRQWRDKANDLARKRAAEMIQRNWFNYLLDKIKKKITELLTNILKRRNETETDKLRRILRKWRDNALELGKIAASRRITNYLTERYFISKARKNWKDLADKLKRKISADSIWELQKRLKEYIILKDVISEINDKIKKDGLDKLKKGDYWLRILEVLRKIFGNINDKNKDIIKRIYLRRWADKTKRLRNREKKLNDALDEIEKRNLINDINTFTDITLTKRITDSIPIARMYDFFERLRNIDKYRKNLMDLKNNLLNKLLRKVNKRIIEILRNKLKQWNDKAQKMKEEAAKNRIAKWTEERYRISNARKNWKKLADLYDLLKKNIPLYELRRRLIEYMILKDLTKGLKNKITKNGMDQFKNGIDFINLINFLKKLIENWDDKNKLTTLRNYLNKWNDIAKKLNNRDKKLKNALDEIEKRQIINDINTYTNACVCKKVTDSIPVARAYDFLKKIRDFYNLRKKLFDEREEILKIIIEKITERFADILRKKLRQWNEKAQKMEEEAAKNRIAKWTEERYRISNARKNWKKLADLYKLFTNKKPLYELIRRLNEYLTLKDLTEKLRKRFAKNGHDQFKDGIKYLLLLKYLKKLFENVDDINNLLKLKHYLNKWNDKTKKLKNRDNKLDKALNEIDKRQLINDINTVNDVLSTKRFNDAIPVARAIDFFKTLKDLEKRRIDLSNYKKNLLRKLINKLIRNYEEILRNKLRQWNDKAKKMKEEAAKNRIAKWTEERYRISNARKNWKKLVDLYDLYIQKRPLYDLRKRLIKFMTLRDLADALRYRFTKTGNDQFKEGIDYALLLKYLKKLFGDVDEINRLILLKHYINKWNIKAKKLKEREDKLRKGMDEIEKRQLIKDVETIADVEITKRINDAIPVARAYDFFDKLRDIVNRKRKLSGLKDELLSKLIIKLSKYTEENLRNKLRQWNDKAKKMKEEAAKNRIAKWTEERYRISNARKNWKKLVDLYDLYIQKRPLYDLRKRLIKFMTLRDLADALRYRFTKTGNDQFKEGIDYALLLKYLKKLFGDVDEINRLIILKTYLDKWNNKAKKLKEREDKLRKAMDEIDKRQLIKDIEIITDSEVTKRFKDAIPVARAIEFFKLIRELEKKRNHLSNYKSNLLRKMVNSLIRSYQDLLRKKLRQWNDKAKKMKEEAAKNRIAKWTEERYRISNARKNWKKLVDLYDLYIHKKPLYELRKRLIKFMTLNDLADKLRYRFTKAGNDQFKEGIDYALLLKYLKKLFGDVDEINRLILLKKYLNDWNNKAKKLKEREDKLKKGMDEIDKRQLINDIDTISNVEITKRFNDAIPVARAYDFFDKFRELFNRKNKLSNLKTDLLIKLFENINRYSEDILRKKLRQWNDKAKKMKEEAAKNRIAKWTEERYRISNARKNWKKLVDLYDLYNQKRPLYDLRKRLIKFMTLRDLADKLRYRFTKAGNDQFKEGINYALLLKYLKKLFGDVDEINRLISLKDYISKWNNKAKKLKEREDKLRKAMDEIDKRQLINDIETITDIEVTKRFKEAIPVARAIDFFKILKEMEKKRLYLSNYKNNILRKIVNVLIRTYQDLLRKKLRQWNDKAKKMKEEAAKNRIAKWTEERYRISNARKNWKKLVDLYDLYNQKRPLYDLRKRLIKFMTLRDLADKLRYRFTKAGNDQFKEGIDYALLLKYLKKLFGDVDDINRLILLKEYFDKWNNKAKILKKKEDKLGKAMEQMTKRQLINDINTIADVEITKKIADAIPVARAYDFFDKLRNLINGRNKLAALKQELLIKIIDRLNRYNNEYLRKKLLQWLLTANKMKEEAAKNRIAKWTEERYRISNARRNWKKLVDLYDLYNQKKPLYDLRKRLIKFMTLRDLADKLRNRFTKAGNDQFKEGVKHLILLKYLKKLFEDIDDINRLLLLKYYLNKWNNKAKKLKQREDYLRDAFDTINLKNLIDATNTLKDVSIIKKVDSSIPVARSYDFLNKLRKISEYTTIYTKLRDDLVKSKDDLDGFNKYKLLRKLYKVYYYKVLDKMFDKLNKLNNRYKNYYAGHFLKLLQYILLSKRNDTYSKIGKGEKEPKIKTLSFRGIKEKKKKIPQERSVLTMLIPSLIKFLNDKFLNHKKWAWEKLADNDRAMKFCKLYRTFADKTINQPKRDLVDLLKAEHSYMNGLGAANCDLFKLLRRYWIKLVCDSMLGPSRIYKILYLIKMVMMHKTIAYQRFIRELVRKWRFSAFILSISRRKLELMYKNLHVSYLQMANDLFGEKTEKNASVVKEFERIVTKMGMFTNEDYNSVNEENFCEKITKRYVFQPMPLLLEKDGPTQFFASGIEIEDSGENNEDYYVDQELGGETIGKYKQETNKSNSKADKNSSRLSKY